MRPLILTLIFASSLISASFDCSKATMPVEHYICKSEQLSALDVELSEHYNTLRYYRSDEVVKLLGDAQLVWLHQRNDIDTTDHYEIIRNYQRQIARLEYFTYLPEYSIQGAFFNMESPAIQKLYSLTVEHDIVPELENVSYYQDTTIFTLQTKDGAARDRGIIAVNIETGVVDTLIRSFTTVVDQPTVGREVGLFKETSLSRGILTTSLGVVYPDPSTKSGLTFSWVKSFECDGESNDCGRGADIGVPNNIAIPKKYWFSKNPESGVDLNYTYDSVNCYTGESLDSTGLFEIPALGWEVQMDRYDEEVLSIK